MDNEKLSKREIVDRLHSIDLERAVLNDEERMLHELLSEWPDDTINLLDDDDSPITEPGTPTSKSSSRFKAVKDPTSPQPQPPPQEPPKSRPPSQKP